MQLLRFIAPLVLFLSCFVGISGEDNLEKVLLQDVSAVTFHPNRMTTGRRSKPVPQLNCIGYACGSIRETSIQCKNQGFDGTDVQWRCEASLPNGYELGETQVSCEGFAAKNDPYVLKGSCGLNYELKRRRPGGSTYYSDDYSGGSWLSTVVLTGFLAFLFVKTCFAPRSSYYQEPRPYYQPYPAGGYYGGSPQSYEYSYGNGSGFWSGVGLGSLGGYYAGRRHYGNYGAMSGRGCSRPSRQHKSTSYASTSRR